MQLSKRTASAFMLLIFLTVTAVALAGGLDTSPSNNRKDAVQSRNDAFNRAKAQYPDPKTVNFPARKALVQFTERTDLLNHPWYVYILGDNGNTIGYYVAKNAPENACNFLSSTQDIYHGDKSDTVMQSPSYDGVYYGESTCDEWFFFDAATNALIEVRGMRFYTADQPLSLNAKPIQVKQ